MEVDENDARGWSCDLSRVEGMTGYKALQLQIFATEAKVTYRDVAIVAAIIHGNLTRELASHVLHAMNVKLTGDGIQKVIDRVLVKTDQLPRCYMPEDRFRWFDEGFPQCTGIVDGVPVPCRGPLANYNSKNGQKSVVFQVIVNLAGIPFAWDSGVEGSRTDAFAFDGYDANFSHSKDEYFLADGMYSASAHCITCWKKKDPDATFTKEQQELFEAHFRKIRSRVEHFFGRLDRHAWFLGARQSQETIASLFNFILHLEARKLRMMNSVLPHYDVKRHADAQVPICDCSCKFVTLNTIPVPQRDTTIFRNNLCRTMCEKNPPMPMNRSSRKGSKLKDKQYVALTKREQRLKFKRQKAARKAVVERVNAQRKLTNKLFRVQQRRKQKEAK